MFKKVLIADDLDSINQGVLTVLKEMGISDRTEVQYCDQAYLKIKAALLQETPFDLLITDLSFKADHRKQKVRSGDDLLQVLKDEHIPLKTIVYSVEDRFQRVRRLYNDLDIAAYVSKGRNGTRELKKAIQEVYDGNRFISPLLEPALSKQRNLDIDEYDIQLMRLLSFGYSQDEIRKELQETNITPNSLSAIEKRLNGLKNKFGASNRVHLISLVKDLGLI
ncbi:MAG: DNA-binding NarL/FixJ family response regulator [Flavobacteriales bacterium]|jgi:DNA-binding NarL/FixJ family response regulator